MKIGGFFLAIKLNLKKVLFGILNLTFATDLKIHNGRLLFEENSIQTGIIVAQCKRYSLKHRIAL